MLGCQNLENSVTSQLKALISWLQGAGHTQLLEVFYLTSMGFLFFKVKLKAFRQNRRCAALPHLNLPGPEGAVSNPGRGHWTWDIRNPRLFLISKLSPNLGVLASKSGRRGCLGVSRELAKWTRWRRLCSLKPSSLGGLPDGGSAEAATPIPPATRGKTALSLTDPCAWAPRSKRQGSYPGSSIRKCQKGWCPPHHCFSNCATRNPQV